MQQDGTKRRSLQRWHDGGWETFAQAEAAFRDIIARAVAAGVHPGEPLHQDYRPCLDWLVAGLAPSERPDGPITHFTFYETGRDHPTGRYGFAFVANGYEWPFSLRGALTGFEAPRYLPDEDSPFYGVTS